MGYHIICVGLGGAIGALLRVGMSSLLTTFGRASHWGTLGVNLLGCFLIGLSWGLFEHYKVHHLVRLFIMTGCLGAFTTFSTFGLESLQLIAAGRFKVGVTYMILSNAIGLLLVTFGVMLSSKSI